MKQEREFADELGRRGQVIVRDRKRLASGPGWLMPKAAAVEVEADIPFTFRFNHFAAAWKKGDIRLAAGAPHPHRTNSDFCDDDEPTKSYRCNKA